MNPDKNIILNLILYSKKNRDKLLKVFLKERASLKKRGKKIKKGES
jgi:hypothetical protein